MSSTAGVQVSPATNAFSELRSPAWVAVSRHVTYLWRGIPALASLRIRPGIASTFAWWNTADFTVSRFLPSVTLTEGGVAWVSECPIRSATLKVLKPSSPRRAPKVARGCFQCSPLAWRLLGGVRLGRHLLCHKHAADFYARSQTMFRYLL